MSETTPTKKSKRKPDGELAAMSRLQRMIETLPVDTAARVLAWGTARNEDRRTASVAPQSPPE